MLGNSRWEEEKKEEERKKKERNLKRGKTKKLSYERKLGNKEKYLFEGSQANVERKKDGKK